MCGYISGFVDVDHMRFCPKCGVAIKEIRGDVIAICDKCGYIFAVIDCEDEDDENNL